MIVVALAVCFAQHQGGPDARAPSPIDLTGSLRIALQHHATALGFLIIGIGAGWTTGEDARIGSVSSALLADRRPSRIVVRRVLALALLAFTSTVLATAAVHLTRASTACADGCAASSRSTWSDVASDAAAATLVIAFIASMALVVALLTRSELLVPVIAIAIFLVPANHAGEVATWAVPSKWIAQVLQVDPSGWGADYSGGKAIRDPTGILAATGASMLIATTLALGWAGTQLLRRRGGEGS